MQAKPILFSTPMVKALLEGRKRQTRRIVKPQPVSAETARKNPYGQPGDVLWVRETWAEGGIYDGTPVPYVYAADIQGVPLKKWRPSIFMPRAAARLFLKITAVRVERLNDITEKDIRREGIVAYVDDQFCMWYGLDDQNLRAETPFTVFSELWDSVNGKGAWQANPFVYVIDFERVGFAKKLDGITVEYTIG